MVPRAKIFFSWFINDSVLISNIRNPTQSWNRENVVKSGHFEKSLRLKATTFFGNEGGI